jgi:hypothetical protein
MEKVFPAIDCTQDCMDDELYRVMSQLPDVIDAMFTDMPQEDKHELGHVVAGALLSAHGYHYGNYHVDKRHFVCRLIASITGLELHEGEKNESSRD